MKTIRETLREAPVRSRLLNTYIGGRSMAVFDIETTGLYPNSSRIMLTGILLPPEEDGAPGEILQFFAEDPSDEEELLRETLAVLCSRDMVMTYNGKSFDMPFLLKRAEKRGLLSEFPEVKRIYDLDLYPILKYHSQLPKVLSSLSQKSVEGYMGNSPMRKDEIDGYESIRRYQRWLISRDPELERTILLHNRDDVAQLFRLLPLLEQTDLDKAFYSFGFPGKNFTIRKTAVSGGELRIQAEGRVPLRDYISFPSQENPWSMSASASLNEAEVVFPLESIRKGTDILDVRTIFRSAGESPLNKKILTDAYPGFESGYLIVRDQGDFSYLGVNLFVKAFFESFGERLFR